VPVSVTLFLMQHGTLFARLHVITAQNNTRMFTANHHLNCADVCVSVCVYQHALKFVSTMTTVKCSASSTFALLMLRGHFLVNDSVGDFTFWLSLWLSLKQVKPEMSQKVKSNFSFGLSHGSVRTFGSVQSSD